MGIYDLSFAVNASITPYVFTCMYACMHVHLQDV